MWVVFGNKTRARPIDGGLAVEQHCPGCNQTRKFVECEVADKVSLFFVSVLDLKSRRLVCQACGEDLEMPAAAPRPRESRPAPPPKARASDKELDRMLADLKKNLGK
jgi:hypothetical protein